MAGLVARHSPLPFVGHTAGTVGVVFAREVADRMMVLCPCDTGSWALRCNSSAPDWLKQQFPVRCAAWASVGQQMARSTTVPSTH
jgi:hypothetical protein